ncbi:peptide chain release factor N(5)-glutamine methyltransferase [Granulicella sp. L60]|uniref:peptide chain release factor N(5)-glutamine methyltransferase n=1 Tax=Granulicella sp. L60 TaxID=1641866 RepID=UPI00131E6CE7|nr:peptide chain release factor N(5)-glutamine methyltransferase [Granulicella sp. L60]
MTLRQVLNAAAAQFAEHEDLRATSNRDAELLLLHALQLSRVTLFAHPDREITLEQQALYQSLVHRRLQLVPIQYITGQQEFYGLLLRVTPAVLIPRPETEHLVEAVLHLLSSESSSELLSIVDVGTGSGAIAIALAVHLPHSEITAIDLSPEALALASANAHEHHVSGRIHFLHSDLLRALSGQEQTFDAIVSNPPYIPESDRSTLHPQVRDHEPSTALFAGEGGLAIYRRLIPQALKALKPNGLLALEIGHGQQDDLAVLLTGWHGVAFVDDLQHIPRVVLARRPTGET